MKSENIIINLGRQLGSGGKVIGEKVAEKLSLKFYNKSILRLAAEESGLATECFERVDEHKKTGGFSAIFEIFRGHQTASVDGGGDVLSGESLFQIQSDLILSLAKDGGCLFVGRCADYILRDNQNCVNIFITANEEDRMKRISELQNVSESEALKIITQGDESRKDYYDFYTTGRWGVASNYDLCINSSKLGIEGTVDFIVSFIKLYMA